MTRFMLKNAEEAYEKMRAEQGEAKVEEEEPQEAYGVTHFDDNHGVVISGGQNDVHIHIGKDGVKVEKKAKTDTIAHAIPAILNTPLAKKVLSKYQKAGYIDKNYQPHNLSRAEKSIVAHSIAEELNIKNMWSLFESFWGTKSMAVDYARALKQPAIVDLMSKINKL